MSKPIYLVLGGVFAVAMFSPSRDNAPAPSAAKPDYVAPPPVTGPATHSMFGETMLHRAPNGHFYANGKVNGTDIRFIVDTGATTIALSRADAARAGLVVNANEFTGTGRGAGGVVSFKPVTLDRVSVGALEATNVDAAIMQGDLDVSLLGQSWLKHVGTVSITGDTMVLK